MANNEGATSIRQQEQALLAQCEEFPFGGPETPGGGPLDILYFTPCRRWLRICENDAYVKAHPKGALDDYDDCYPDDEKVFEGERASIVNSACVYYYFCAYEFSIPKQLDRPSKRRDVEVSVFATGLEKSITRLEAFVRTKRGTFKIKQICYPRLELDSRFPRNSLLQVLRVYSRSWSRTQITREGDPSLSGTGRNSDLGNWADKLRDVEKEILMFLRRQSDKQTGARVSKGAIQK